MKAVSKWPDSYWWKSSLIRLGIYCLDAVLLTCRFGFRSLETKIPSSRSFVMFLSLMRFPLETSIEWFLRLLCITLHLSVLSFISDWLVDWTMSFWNFAMSGPELSRLTESTENQQLEATKKIKYLGLRIYWELTIGT